MRFKNVIRNSFFSILSQLVLIILGFFSSRVINLELGEALVGVNGVIANFLGILSVTELGFSTAVVYHLYKVLAEDQEERIAALMNLYRRAYQIISMVILGLGICFLPFIHLFIKENPFSKEYVRILYSLWLLRTVSNYLLSYRRSILIADQKEYVVSIMILGINILDYTSIIVVVLYSKNYIPALALNVFFESLMSILLNHYVDKKYPYLKTYRKVKIDKKSRDQIFADMKNIFFSKLSFKVLVSTDNLVISGTIGVVINGFYNNYVLIFASVINLVAAISDSIQPTMGNLFLEKDTKKNYDVFCQISFLFFVISAFIASGLASLATPFVRDFWLGPDYVLEDRIILFMVLSTVVTVMGYPLTIVMSVSGMFRVERNLSIAAALSNLILSLLLVRPLGVCGVIIGTIFSNLLYIVVRSWFFFRKYLNMHCIKYVVEMCMYSGLIFIEAYATRLAVGKIYESGNLWSVFGSCMVCLLLPNLVNLLVFFRSWRFQSMLRMILKK